MSAILILVIGIVLLALGYIFYGSWLAKKWGVNPDRPTPAHSKFDNKDYVPANPAVLMGHHFSSIAGAGPINGPIQAAVFGWLPVFLWIVIGGIFFGAMHDFGALFASIRHGGRSIGEVIKDNIGGRAYKLFVIFALIVLILVIAVFTSVVASTFVSVAAEGEAALPLFTTGAAVSGNAATATTSLLFIVIAFFFGYFVYRKGTKIGPATIAGVIGIIAITWIGLSLGFNMSRTAWVIFIAVYITFASLLPVWMLLQPRDYLSSFLLYGMIILAVVGVFGSGANMEVPAFTSWTLANGNMLFPTLFITVACGAISGFHSLVGSGTTSKQLSSEKDAKIIGYGAMIVECVLALIALISVGVIYSLVLDGTYGLNAPPRIFAAGIATMVAWMTGSEAAAGNGLYDVVYTLITLAVSIFALTSLDTGTRLGRYMFTELFVREDEDASKITGFRGFLAKPIVGTLILVIVGCTIGFLSLSQIWGLFGAANQLLAGLALLAVACWLGNIGKSNKMFFIPMVFMLLATLTSLVLTLVSRFKAVAAGGADWGVYFQIIFALALVILAFIVTVDGLQALGKQKKGEITGDPAVVEATK
ncbi:MAG: carbon starvation protein A [Clostridia bacterium]|nr:carbon starvation protein A [Clostridia bacterium]